MISKNGVPVHPKKVEAITNMSEPTGVGQLRRFLGVVDQVGKYMENLAEMAKPLRDLLNKNCLAVGQFSAESIQQHRRGSQ